jgi:hypothetical protein
VLAAADQDHPARFITEAEDAARSITPKGGKGRTLAEIVKARAVTDLDRAERVALSIADEFSQVKALVIIAEA